MILKSLKITCNTLNKYYLNILIPTASLMLEKNPRCIISIAKLFIFSYFENFYALGSPASFVWPQG